MSLVIAVTTPKMIARAVVKGPQKEFFSSQDPESVLTMESRRKVRTCQGLGGSGLLSTRLNYQIGD
jgi:hypothetical protein